MIQILIIVASSTLFSLDSNDFMPVENTTKADYELATFGAGCFWCVEAVFERVRGVESVISGYAGGNLENPTYRDVTSGLTGHAEVAQIKFDPTVVSFTELLEIFWKTHDPTTINRQGADVGTQYRSVIFYHDDNQRQLAESYKIKLDQSGAFVNPIVTEIVAYPDFYVAEDYHQEYYENNANQPYCQYVIVPKLDKLEAVLETN